MVDFFQQQVKQQPDNRAWKEQLAQWYRTLIVVLAKQKNDPAAARQLTDALERLVQVHEALGQKDQAEKWRKILQKQKKPKS